MKFSNNKYIALLSFLLLFVFSFLFSSCIKKRFAQTVSLELQTKNDTSIDFVSQENSLLNYKESNPFIAINNSIINVVLYDKFNPPVASRIFAYTNLTAHLVLSNFGLLKSPKLNIQISNNYSTTNYDTSFIYAVALTSQKIVAKNLVWSSLILENNFNEIINKWIINHDLQNKRVEIDSISLLIANEIILQSQKDGYVTRLANKRYEVLYDVENAWKPTAPSYQLPVEPHWKVVNTFYNLDRNKFYIQIPFEFSYDTSSSFYAINKELYFNTEKLSPTEKITAKHWDCNPIQTKNVGHVKLFSFRHTPAAHWLLFISDILLHSKISTEKSIELYSYLSTSMADAFTICWDLKYQNNFIRPETYINKYIKKEWKPFIETPSFPEYPSGHSLISTTASQICNHYLGDKFGFIDSTQRVFNLPDKYFSSFNQAANDAGISRYYGGIHYLQSIENGNIIGKYIGSYVVKNYINE